MGWFTGDVIAGLTVGMVLVPQGMSYAQVYIFLNSSQYRLLSAATF